MGLTLTKPSLKYASFLALFLTLFQLDKSAMASEGKKPQGVDGLVAQYSNELLVVACIFLLGICSIIGVFYKAPIYGGKPMPMGIKLPICVASGFIMFLYCLHVDKELTLLTPIYVGAVSFISPAIIHLVHAFLIDKFAVKFGIDLEAMEKLNRKDSSE